MASGRDLTAHVGGTTPRAHADAIVIGAGPGGLAAAAELGRRGLSVVVLERADRPGFSWTRHYDRLHLHTARGLSGLPGFGIPRRYGRWVARDDVVAYLGEYAQRHELDVHTAISADRIDREADGWAVSWSKTGLRGQTEGTSEPDAEATTAGKIVAPIVVVATGYNHTARLPRLPGIDDYRGTLVHSSEYRNPAALGARDVLVVGPGNSGAEIAADLAESGARVRMAVRTPPNIVTRSVLGIPSQALVISMDWMPVRAQDRMAAMLQKLTVGDLRKYGLAKAPRGLATQQIRDDVTPTLDVGMLSALRAGKITVVPAVVGFDGDEVLLADGARIKPEAVVFATGFSRGLEPLVGHLDVLGAKGRPRVNAEDQLPKHPGLYFIGYSNPLAGNFRQIAIDARKIARAAA